LSGTRSAARRPEASAPRATPTSHAAATRAALDWRAWAFLEGLRIAGWPSVADRSLVEARADLRLLCASTSIWQPVARVGELSLLLDGSRVAMRVYEPLTPRSGPRPLLVWLHGGGFVLGSLDTADASCRSLANRSGAVVVSIDYRLAPEAGCLAGADDAYRALRWALTNARSLGCDPGRVVIGGESAGATLSALSTLRCRDAGGPLPALQVLVYPCTDCSMALSDHQPGTARLLTWESVDWFAAHCFADLDPASPRISPYWAPRHDGLSPALVITAECDLLCSDGETYAALLRAAGNDVTLTRYPGQIHGFFTMDLLFPCARAAQREVGRAIAALAPGPPARHEHSAPALPIVWSSPVARAMSAGRALSDRLPPSAVLRAGRTVLQHKLRQFTTAAFAIREPLR